MSIVRVNEELKSINTVVNNMDIVEITTNKEMVSSDWLNYAQTAKAMKEISELLQIFNLNTIDALQKVKMLYILIRKKYHLAKKSN